MDDKKNTSNYPSHFVPQSVKQGIQWNIQNCQALHTEPYDDKSDHHLNRANKNYERMRKYGRGEQSQHQYKESLALKKKKDGSLETTFRNLNFEIFKFAPKIVNVLINRVVGQKLDMKCRPVDPRSISERRKYKNKLLEYLMNKEVIEQFEKLTKIGLEKPIPEGEEPPANAMEIDPYLDMYPKDITSMEVLDFLELNRHENDWPQQSKEIVRDLIEIGVAGTRQYIDFDNKIKFRRIIPERCKTNRVIYPDYRDLIRFAEYREVTVSELKKLTKGEWGEDVYKKIANSVAGQQGKKYNGASSDYLLSNNYSYAYDHEKVTIMDCLWYSTDTEVHMQYQNGSGNVRVKKMEDNYVPFKGDAKHNNGKGVSDSEFSKMSGGKSKILRTEVRNVYQCSWVVDTEYAFNYGLMPNMLRTATNWQDTIMPVKIVSTDFVSTLSLLEQPIDQVQLNYLQYQSHVAASRPPGIAIEKHALSRLAKGTKDKWDPVEALRMYAETGNLVYDNTDQHGNAQNNGYPFLELKNGLSQGAMDHLNIMKDWIMTARDMCGLNALSEGLTPPERQNNKVAEMALGASDNAIDHITKAYRSIYQGTSQNTFYLLQNNVQRMNPEQMSESLGVESWKYHSLNSDLSLIDMGIILEEGPDDLVIESINATLDTMVLNKEIPGEQVVLIKMQKTNPYRQILMLRKHRKELERSRLAEQQSIVQTQAEAQGQQAMELEKVKKEGLAEASAQKMKELEFAAMTERESSERKHIHEYKLKQLEMGVKQNIADETNDTAIEVAEISAESKEKSAKSKPK